MTETDAVRTDRGSYAPISGKRMSGRKNVPSDGLTYVEA